MKQPTMPTAVSWITRRPHWFEGIEACIRDTNISVWSVIERRKLGLSDEDIVESYQGFSAEDLKAALGYYLDYPEEIDKSIRENAEA